MIQIDALPAFNDNYIWLLQDATSRRCAVVDPGDAKPVEAWLATHPDWRLSDILVTHHHHDHVGGVAALKELDRRAGSRPGQREDPGPRPGAGRRRTGRGARPGLRDLPRARPYPRPYRLLPPGGDAAAVLRRHPVRRRLRPSLRRHPGADAPFPGATGRAAGQHPVYCTHEYTLSNLRFALAVEPDNAALRERFEEATRLRERDRITLPSEISLELSTNPFLRVSENLLRKSRPAERPAKPHPGGGFRRPEGLEGPVLKVGEILTTLEVISRIG